MNAMSIVRNLFTTLVGYEARKHTKGHGLRNFGLGMIAARIATGSVPGALLVGGALIAKKIYDGSKEAEALPASETIIDIEGRPVPEDSDATPETPVLRLPR
jgi:hypothetical protein